MKVNKDISGLARVMKKVHGYVEQEGDVEFLRENGFLGLKNIEDKRLQSVIQIFETYKYVSFKFRL